MKIIRNDVEIELTEDEIIKVYDEKKKEYYILDIEEKLDELIEDGELEGYTHGTIISNINLLEAICEEFDMRDTSDEYWDVLKYYIKKNIAAML